MKMISTHRILMAASIFVLMASFCGCSTIASSLLEQSASDAINGITEKDKKAERKKTVERNLKDY